MISRSDDEDMPAWRLFWAKTDYQNEGKPSYRGDEWTHPLWAHLIDVACVAEVLWKVVVPVPLKQKLREATGLDKPAHALSLWIGLHDAGKAIPGFQEQHKASWKKLCAAGVCDAAPANKRHHHGFASVPILQHWLADSGLSARSRCLLDRLALFVGFHHGRLCKQSNLDGPPGALGDEQWTVVQQQLIDAVVAAWDVRTWPDSPEAPEPWPSWLLGFAGWVTLADWVGSMTKRFPEARHDSDLRDYIRESRKTAEKVVAEIGLADRASLVRHDPSMLFGFESLREVQKRVYRLPLPERGAPTLTIVEAPTGEGKTEAALALAARQQIKRGGSGIYIAMPTMATSNGLFPRFRRFLERAHDAENTPANVVLLHGTADLHPKYQKLLDGVPETADIHDEDDQWSGRSGRVRAQRWFLPKKRGLLAPYGIGTVDQALLGVLFSKHFFLRLFGLSGKTVIFDEVHAYDTYMSMLFERLLRWLRVLDVNVILLSATLPTATRARLLEAWGTSKEEAQREADHPAIWHVHDGTCDLKDGFPTHQEGRTVKLEWCPSDRENIGAIIKEVHQAVEAGAAVAVIVNQVDRAQKIYHRLTTGEDALPLAANDCHLLHARYPLEQRYARETAAIQRFGKTKKPGDDETPRPAGPAVLVATQVAEQSLDLDFDLMLSDLAPIDLLLQRAGRMHRHALPYTRPDGYREARLILLCPEPDEAGLPAVDEVGYVYDTLTLLRTWHLLQNRDMWTLPDDYRVLIDGVYVPKMHKSPIPGDLPTEGRRAWKKARHAFRKTSRQEGQKAKNRYINAPKDLDNLLSHDHLELHDEEDPKTHEDFKALTRSGLPSVSVICLHCIGDRLYLDAEGKTEAPFNDLPASDAVRALLKRSVRISKQVLVRHFREWAPPDSWSDAMKTAWTEAASNTAALYFYRPMIFENGVWREGPVYGRLDSALGLVYE